MTASSKHITVPKTQKMHELYLKRRGQRINALKKVIKQWHRLEDAERFFRHARNVAFRHDSFVPDSFFELVADQINEEEIQSRRGLRSVGRR